MQHYDLIIIGSGLVGTGLALALRQSGLSIAVADARLPSNNDPRLFALNSSSCQFLKNLGLWPKLSEHAAPIHQVHVSQQGRFGAVRLQRNDVQLPELGYVIPARFIEAAMHEALLSSPSITLYQPAKLQALKQHDGQAVLTLTAHAGDITLQSPLVIGADGTESTVRTQLNIATTIFDYKQSALVTRTMLQRSHQYIAYERFTQDGAIAMLPLTGNECATIWTADTATITKLMSMSDELFLQTLQKEFGYRLGRLQHVAQRHVFPLRMVRAEKAVDQCVFLLGNSAHTLHPIAAQGFNLALYEAAALVEGVLEKLAKQETLTAADLEKISAQTQQQQSTSIGVSHRLPRLFSKDTILISIALQLGMIGLDLAAPVKKKFIEGMMGKTGRVPRLLLSANEL